MRKDSMFSKAECKRLIEEYANDTDYFNGSITYNDMYEMFRERYEFGVAETVVILSSLILAGAKFPEEVYEK